MPETSSIIFIHSSIRPVQICSDLYCGTASPVGTQQVETEVRALKFDDTGLFLLAGLNLRRSLAQHNTCDSSLWIPVNSCEYWFGGLQIAEVPRVEAFMSWRCHEETMQRVMRMVSAHCWDSLPCLPHLPRLPRLCEAVGCKAGYLSDLLDYIYVWICILHCISV